MSLHSIFNSLWNMDLTFIFKVSGLILAIFILAILGYGLLVSITNRIEQSEICRGLIDKYHNLLGLKKLFVDYLILAILIVPFLILFFIIFKFLLPIFGLN